jgi:hypothetical protein
MKNRKVAHGTEPLLGVEIYGLGARQLCRMRRLRGVRKLSRHGVECGSELELGGFAKPLCRRIRRGFRGAWRVCR